MASIDGPIEPRAVVEIRQAVLERLEVAATSAVTNQFLADAQFSAMRDFVADSLIIRLRAHVLADPQRRQEREHVITEEPIYDSWLDHLHASLPTGGFRGRWLTYFRGHEPRARRRVHTITVRGDAIFPASQHQFPDSLGELHFVVHDDATYQDLP